MGWLGKVVGGTIGFALGGPVGAVAGAVFGHGFDKKEEHYLSRLRGSRESLSSGESAQMTFFVAAFSMIAKMAKADGRVSEEEIASIEAFMRRDLRLDSRGRHTAIMIFRQALHSSERFDDFAVQFFRVFQHQPRMIELMMDVLFRVSAADGTITAQEEALLLTASRIFRISAGDYGRLKSKYEKNTRNYYAVLNCDPGDADEVIKKQYRKLVSEFHPDKIESRGLPGEFVRFASDRFMEIQEAYDHIRKERGM